MYLGIMLDEFLDYNVTSKYVAQSAGRALGLRIAKLKKIKEMLFCHFKESLPKNAGGLPYGIYTILIILV